MEAESNVEEYRKSNAASQNTSLLKRPILWGFGGAFALLSVFFLILIVANSADHAVEEFLAVWYWILPLTVGFGTQVGLFSYIRHATKFFSNKAAASSVALSGGVSTTSMVACCAHHVTDLVPFLGATAAAVFLTRFQSTFMVVGIFSNLIGILVMLRIIRNGGLYHGEQPIMSRLVRINFAKAIGLVVITGVISTGMSIYMSL